MSRKIIIDKYEGNTCYSVHVIDSFGQEHHLGYLSDLTIDELKFLNYPTNGHTNLSIIEQATDIWENEVEPKEDLMSKAIKECIEIDRKAGITSRNRDGLD